MSISPFAYEDERATLTTIGGYDLAGSDFETEIPDSDFADAEASDESAGK